MCMQGPLLEAGAGSSTSAVLVCSQQPALQHISIVGGGAAHQTGACAQLEAQSWTPHLISCLHSTVHPDAAPCAEGDSTRWDLPPLQSA